MIKHGAVVAGETPSEVSGKTSEIIKSGTAVLRDEEPSQYKIENIKIVDVAIDDSNKPQ